MNIELPQSIIASSVEALRAAGLNEPADFIETRVKLFGKPTAIEVSVDKLGIQGLDALRTVAKDNGERGLMMLITSYRNIIESPLNAKIGNLKALGPGIISFLLKDSIDGWLYHEEADGVLIPWLVRHVKYVEATQHNPAHIAVRLSANVAADVEGRNSNAIYSSVCFYADDIAKKNIPELFARLGYYHETPELKASYEADLAKFSQFQPMFGKQFRVTGKVLVQESYKQKLIDVLPNSKMINDEGAITRVIIDNVLDDFWLNQKNAPVFDKQPYHCRIYFFDLSLHTHVWAHVSFIKPYEYKPELRDKLILPTLHRDLIDILTADMDVIFDDIVEGKSGGTTILCKGAPGLGKTLTAEVYSEVVQKPLYRVHSGQLGTDAESVEKELKTILTRAARWGVVLLLDEADVFVRKRDNDIDHNAVVAVFLRTLEYFHGLLFMTTNRADDIDDAILSRCIAIIKYEHPTREDAKKLWNVLSAQIDAELSDNLIEELVTTFSTASGRDIKELLKLSSKFARRKGIPLTADVFRQCAMFRGML